MTKTKMALLAGTVIFIGAASGAVWQIYFSRSAGVIKQVKRVLNDPDSAKFEHVEFFPRTGAGCGVVNARNRMGGYVGYTRFVALADGSVEFDPGPHSESAPPERRLEDATKRLHFLELMAAKCPDK